MKQAISGGMADVVHSSTTEYNFPSGGDLWSNNKDIRKQKISAPGTFSRLLVVLNDSPGAGNKYNFVLMVNGNPTGIDAEISGAATTGIDTVNTAAVVADDDVSLRCDPDSSPTSRVVHWSIVFEGTNAKESNIIGAEFNNALPTADGVTEYHTIAASERANWGTENNARMLLAPAGTIKNFYIELDQAPGAGDSLTFKVRINGADSGIQVVISGGAAVTGNDTGNTKAINPGDIITLEVTVSGTSASVSVWWGLTFEATIDGESPILGGSTDSPHNTDTEYMYPSGQMGTWTTVVTDRDHGGQACIIKDLYVLLTASPGAGNSFDFTLTQDGAPSALTVEVAGGDTTGNDTDNDVTIADYELLSFQAVPTDTPSSRDTYWGMVCYIAPAVVTFIPQVIVI